MKEKRKIEEIFKEIEDLIWQTKSVVPIEIKNSKFLKGLKVIKDKYLN